MAVMLLPGMKGSPLLVQRTVTRTNVLQGSIGKVLRFESEMPPTGSYFECSALNFNDDCLAFKGWDLADQSSQVLADVYKGQKKESEPLKPEGMRRRQADAAQSKARGLRYWKLKRRPTQWGKTNRESQQILKIRALDFCVLTEVTP
ncbi:hypothetical protein STEG23_000876 [Scotinomys teguina]